MRRTDHWWRCWWHRECSMMMRLITRGRKGGADSQLGAASLTVEEMCVDETTRCNDFFCQQDIVYRKSTHFTTQSTHSNTQRPHLKPSLSSSSSKTSSHLRCAEHGDCHSSSPGWPIPSVPNVWAFQRRQSSFPKLTKSPNLSRPSVPTVIYT